MSTNGGGAGLDHGASTPFSPLSSAAATAAIAGQFASEDETVHKSVGDVTLLIGASRDEGVGNLLITTKRLLWTSNTDQSKAFSVGYKAIIVHAISRDVQSFDRPCIYVQLDEEYGDDQGDDDEEEGAGESAVSELRLAPADPDHLEHIFQAMSECAAMNPDSDMDDDEGEFFYNEDEVAAGADPAQRETMLAHYDSILRGPEDDDLEELMGDDPERFDDAEEQ
mmetsp:Transcript_42580/g.109006  ORF Transcript_42580/g.109006 Transcript_42580/m.109006 type:complete len:224 (-) Transcript_42580:473-1144(-)